jgi:hypothetical protein
MTIDRRLIAGALGLTLALAACGGSSTASPTASAAATPAPTQAPGSTPAPTEAPTDNGVDQPTEAPTDNGIDPSFQAGAAGDLEALLPDEAGGIKFAKTSFDGASLGAAAMGIDTGELGPLLKANGKTINDVRVAIASPADTSGGETAMVIALQVKGVPADKLLGATGMDTSSLTNTTVGGKQVLKAAAGGFTVIIYTKDDVLFEVLLASDPVATDIVGKLP